MQRRIDEIEEHMMSDAAELLKKDGLSVSIVVGIKKESERKDIVRYMSRLSPKQTLIIFEVCLMLVRNQIRKEEEQ